VPLLKHRKQKNFPKVHKASRFQAEINHELLEISHQLSQVNNNGVKLKSGLHNTPPLKEASACCRQEEFFIKKSHLKEIGCRLYFTGVGLNPRPLLHLEKGRTICVRKMLSKRRSEWIKCTLLFKPILPFTLSEGFSPSPNGEGAGG
jgi:hypothetical protein